MKFFYKKISLNVPENVYLPREDSELLASVLAKQKLAGKRCLDMGCGSGFLAILMAKKKAIVIAADISRKAVNAAHLNAEKNGVKIKVIQSDLFEKIKEKFDIIVFNPPYLPVDEKDKTYSGGESGRDVIERVLKQAKRHLNENGIVFLTISSLTGEKEVIELFREHGMKAEVIARKKVPWEELMVIEACL